MSGLVVCINTNPTPATRTGVRALVRAVRRLVSSDVRVVERHFLRADAALEADAVLLGPQGVPFDAYPPEHRERLFALIRALQGPLLGVCGGHQALVLAHGGAIGPVHGGVASGTYAGHARERGFRAVTLSQDTLTRGLPAVATVFASHVEGVTSLPPTFRLLGTGEACRVQVVRLGDRPIWGVQFHPERGGDGPALLASFLCAAGL